VYVIQNDIAHMRGIKPGVTDGGLTQVDGINAGDVVANSSFDKLQENVAVVVPGQAQAPKKGSTKPATSGANGGSAP